MNNYKQLYTIINLNSGHFGLVWMIHPSDDAGAAVATISTPLMVKEAGAASSVQSWLTKIQWYPDNMGNLDVDMLHDSMILELWTI